MEHQLEFIDQRSDAEAGRLLSRMAPDDAADLISEIEQDRRMPLLESMPEAQQRKVRNLLSYPAESAGGLDEPRLRLGPIGRDRRGRPRVDPQRDRAARGAERALRRR